MFDFLCFRINNNKAFDILSCDRVTGGYGMVYLVVNEKGEDFALKVCSELISMSDAPSRGFVTRIFLFSVR